MLTNLQKLQLQSHDAVVSFNIDTDGGKVLKITMRLDKNGVEKAMVAQEKGDKINIAALGEIMNIEIVS